MEGILRFFDQAPIALFYKDLDNNVIKVNQTFIDVFGYKNKSEIEGKNCKELFGEELAEKYYKDDLEVVKTNKPKKDILEKTVTPVGERLCRTDKVPYKDDSGKIVGILGFLLDITEQTTAFEEVVKLKTAIEQSPSTVVITDTDGKIEYVNPRFNEITGYPYKEVLGKNPKILKSGKMKQEEYEKLWRTISSGKIWWGEFLNKTKTGELYWEVASISPVKDSNGNITNYIKVAEVVTEMKQTLANLWNVLNYTQFFIIVFDKDLKIKICNHSLAKFLGFQNEHELIGMNWLDFIPIKEHEIVSHAHKETLAGSTLYEETITSLTDANNGKQLIKWHNAAINQKANLTFSLGIQIKHPNDLSTLEDTREFFEKVLEKDRLTILAIKSQLSSSQHGSGKEEINPPSQTLNLDLLKDRSV